MFFRQNTIKMRVTKIFLDHPLSFSYLLGGSYFLTRYSPGAALR